MSVITCAQNVRIVPSRLSRPRVPDCFSRCKALYASYTVTGEMVRAEFEVFESQKSFQ